MRERRVGEQGGVVGCAACEEGIRDGSVEGDEREEARVGGQGRSVEEGQACLMGFDMPLVVYRCLQSIEILSRGTRRALSPRLALSLCCCMRMLHC